MIKKWVQISFSQAKIIGSFHAGGGGVLLFIGLIASAFSGFILAPFLGFILAKFLGFLRQFIEIIETNLLHGEPIFETIPIVETIEGWLPFVSFLIPPFVFTLILLSLGTVVDDELIFNLDEGTIKRILKSRLSKLLKRQGSVKQRLGLFKYSKVSLRFDSEVDDDSDTSYFYSLKLIGDPPGNDFEIDRLYSYAGHSFSKELAELEHLGRQLADFLKIPMVSEIGTDR